MVSVYFTCEGRLVIIRSFARCVFFLLLPATSPDASPHHSYPCLSYAGWVHTEHCRIPSPTLPSCWIRADPIDKKHAWLSQLDGQPRPGMVRGRSHCNYFAAHISHAPSHVNRSAAQRVTPPQQKKARKGPRQADAEGVVIETRVTGKANDHTQILFLRPVCPD